MEKQPSNVTSVELYLFRGARCSEWWFMAWLLFLWKTLKITDAQWEFIFCSIQICFHPDRHKLRGKPNSLITIIWEPSFPKNSLGKLPKNLFITTVKTIEIEAKNKGDISGLHILLVKKLVLRARHYNFNKSQNQRIENWNIKWQREGYVKCTLKCEDIKITRLGYPELCHTIGLFFSLNLKKNYFCFS